MYLKFSYIISKTSFKKNNFDDAGNIAFGVQEYIDLKGIKYDPDIGIFGLTFNITLEKPGYHVKRRRLKPAKIPSKHKISKQDAIEFMKEKFGVEVEEE